MARNRYMTSFGTVWTRATDWADYVVLACTKPPVTAVIHRNRQITVDRKAILACRLRLDRQMTVLHRFRRNFVTVDPL